MAYNIRGDLNIGRRLELSVHTSGAIPAIPGVDGAILFDSSNNEINLYHTGMWNPIGGGGADTNYAENNLTADADRTHTWGTNYLLEQFTDDEGNPNWTRIVNVGADSIVLEASDTQIEMARNADTRTFSVSAGVNQARIFSSDGADNCSLSVNGSSIAGGPYVRLDVSAAGGRLELDFDASAELEINGDAGVSGYAITSTGPNSPPVWAPVGGGADTHYFANDLTGTDTRNHATNFAVNETFTGAAAVKTETYTVATETLTVTKDGSGSFGVDFTNTAGTNDQGRLNVNGAGVFLESESSSDINSLRVGVNGIDLVFETNGRLTVDSNAGTSGQVLTSNGTSSPPTWETPAATPLSIAEKLVLEADALNGTGSVSGAANGSTSQTTLGTAVNLGGATNGFLAGTDITQTANGFTINTAGTYRITADISSNGPFSGDAVHIFQLVQNTTTVLAASSGSVSPNTNNGDPIHNSFSKIVALAASDTISMALNATGGGWRMKTLQFIVEKIG